jgi:hypothetical protein
MLGYDIDSVDPGLADDGYHFTMQNIGRVCMKGNKANFSFDERFLVTHHYNDPDELRADPDPDYATKGSADIWVSDFVEGKAKRAVKMGPGQYALYPHFRSDGWLYFLVVDRNTSKYYAVASDWAIKQAEAIPTP